MSLLRVALTGGVASGKSTVAGMLREAGAVVIDADVLAREVVEPGTPGLRALVEEFGPEVLTGSAELDRAALGRLVFADEPARRRLEAILHPLVRERGAMLEAQARTQDPPPTMVVHDIPLLAETGQAGEFDEVIVVEAPTTTQVERMRRDRGWSEEDARSRIAAQAERTARLAVATYVVENTGSLAALAERVRGVHEAIVGPRDPRRATPES